MSFGWRRVSKRKSSTRVLRDSRWWFTAVSARIGARRFGDCLLKAVNDSRFHTSFGVMSGCMARLV